MVTGGRGQRGVGLDSVELLNMDGTWICSMPPLPNARIQHSQTGTIVCGGRGSARVPEASKSCVTFSSDGDDWNWMLSHNLTKRRRDHGAWASPLGVMLIGTDDIMAESTTEILTEDGDTIPGFTMDPLRA